MQWRRGRSVFDLIDEVIKIIVRLPGWGEIPGDLHPCLLLLHLPDWHVWRWVRFYWGNRKVKHKTHDRLWKSTGLLEINRTYMTEFYVSWKKSFSANALEFHQSFHSQIPMGVKSIRLLVVFPVTLVTHRKAEWTDLISSSLWSRMQKQREVREEYEHWKGRKGSAALRERQTHVIFGWILQV